MRRILISAVLLAAPAGAHAAEAAAPKTDCMEMQCCKKITAKKSGDAATPTPPMDQSNMPGMEPPKTPKS